MVVVRRKISVTDTEISGNGNEEAELFQNTKTLKRNREHVELPNKRDTNNNRGKWNHSKIFLKVPAKYTWKARPQGRA
jgi:hypothetical protein